MLLFLKDPGMSLHAVLGILDEFAKFSGLKVNWDKSNILPLNSGTDPGLPLQWVNQFIYLGVRISARTENL